MRVLFLIPLLFALPAEAQVFNSQKTKFHATTVAAGLEHPWGLAFLPDGRLLVTERPGRMRLVLKNGSLSKPLAGVPPVYSYGQGGLLDVALDPKFSENNIIYFSYAEPGEGGAGTAVARAELKDEALEKVKVIFRQQPKVEGPNHWGSRLVPMNDGTLFITMGDRYTHKDKAQTLDNHFGKVVRVKTDGGVPADNPFVKTPGALPEIWSYGHRNVQGATYHNGKLWTHEHGAKGGDEVNITEAGKNYGWPKITHGVDYSGKKISEFTHMQGMEQPLHYWVPSIAPSGMAFYTGARFPAWKGNLFVGGLACMCLSRLEIGANGAKEELLLRDFGERIRDVRQGPDELLYLLTDSDEGRIVRLEPL